MAVIGPPGSGKTTATLVPHLILSRGPAVAVTTKATDLFRPTAQTRARLGQLWHYNPGYGETLPGTTELRWSPITGAEDWSEAVYSANLLTQEVLDVQGNESSSGQFFKLSATHVVAVLLHAAALMDKPMMFVLNGLAGSELIWHQVERVVFSKGSPFAASWYDAIWAEDDRTRRNVFSSAALVFDVFATPKPYASTEDANFSADEFARSTDTIYITADKDEQEALTPVFVHLLKSIERSQRRLFDADEREGLTRPPMYWALDELSSMARLRKFPQLISQSGSTGLEIAACLQDLSQAERLWGAEGKNLLSLMSAVVFPGVVNRDTIETIALLTGKHWVTRRSQSWSSTESESTSFTRSLYNSASESTGSSTTSGHSESHYYVEHTTAGDVFSGTVGDARPAGAQRGRLGERVIWLHSGAVSEAMPLPYFRSAPFNTVLAGNAHWIASNCLFDERVLLPTPDLVVDLLPIKWRQRYLEARLSLGPIRRRELEA